MTTYNQILKPAFAGMKADSGYDRVESYLAETAIPFGVVVTLGTSANQVKLGGTTGIGVALHSHTIVNQYESQDTVSVITKGLVWCQVKTGGTCTDRGAVKFDPATGVVSDAETETLANAIFRGKAVDTDKYGLIVQVELK